MKDAEALIAYLLEKMHDSGYHYIMAEIEAAVVSRALAAYPHDITMAAASIGLQRTTMHMKLKKFGLLPGRSKFDPYKNKRSKEDTA